jgi:hypothetical protein
MLTARCISDGRRTVGGVGAIELKSPAPKTVYQKDLLLEASANCIEMRRIQIRLPMTIRLTRQTSPLLVYHGVRQSIN